MSGTRRPIASHGIGLAVLGCCLLTLAPSNAYAYIDPGTGSFLVQGLIAAALGLGLTLKLFWRRLKSALTGRPARDEDAAAHE